MLKICFQKICTLQELSKLKVSNLLLDIFYFSLNHAKVFNTLLRDVLFTITLLNIFFHKV